MKEDLLSYIWRYRLWENEKMQTTEGLTINIIDVGLLNRDAGPDYSNAKIKIENTLWAGNVELHIKSIDWYRHGHEKDPAYNNVILHVVTQADQEIKNEKGDTLPQLELKIAPKYIQIAQQLAESKEALGCHRYWNEQMRNRLRMQMNTLLCERLENKVQNIEQLLDSNKNDWEETLYQKIAKSFGMKTNELPFEQLAKSLPQKYIGKQKGNLLQVESMIIGQAGLLENIKESDTYIQSLQQEYHFLKQKYNLQPIDKGLWKFGKMRPTNSPYVRLAEFAMLCNQSEHLFSKVLEAKGIEEIQELFNCGTSEYWDMHYTLGICSEKRIKYIGAPTRNSIIINSVIPLIFAWGKENGEENRTEEVLDLLEKIPAEDNRIIAFWREQGIEALSAYETQALIEQTKEYCEKKECLRCSIGHQIFKETSNKKQ